MVIELGGSGFEITHDLVGDLFRAKNAGVTDRGRRALRLRREASQQRLASCNSSAREQCRAGARRGWGRWWDTPLVRGAELRP
jgi:hypothetical protein